jgi:hypothetical protein
MNGKIALILAGTALLWGCGGDPSGPSRAELAGTYVLTDLRFDPQGVLPEIDLAARLEVNDVQLVLAPDGQAQLRYTDPATSLLTTVGATYSTPVAGARVHFDQGPGLRAVLLSSRMTFDFTPSPGTLLFDGASPDGVDRQRLLELVPEWSEEQLFNPVPGRLVVEFTRASQST